MEEELELKLPLVKVDEARTEQPHAKTPQPNDWKESTWHAAEENKRIKPVCGMMTNRWVRGEKEEKEEDGDEASNVLY